MVRLSTPTQTTKYMGVPDTVVFNFRTWDTLIGMWDTREVITGLPYDFSHLITTHFAEFYKKHMTTFVLSEKQREALGISEAEYTRANKAVWGENWKNQ